MAKRRKKARKTIVKYRTRPVTKWRTRYKVIKPKAKRVAKTLIGGINVGGALKDLFPLFCGALAAKFAAKKFAEGGAETENWTWKNYGWGILGMGIAAVGTSAIFRGRRNVAQKVFEGGLLLLTYKLFTNELAPRSEYLESWFGEDEDIYPDMSGYSDNVAREGDIWQNQNEAYVMGADGYYRPVSEMHRQVLPQHNMGIDIQPADPTFGIDIEPADPTFGKTITDEYEEAYAKF